MITGTENIYPQTDSNYINNSDDTPTVGVWGGITLKQHMVIEFTKAIMTGFASNNTALVNYTNTAVKSAICLANEVIKQLNDEAR